jgi:hypothetical protein
MGKQVIIPRNGRLVAKTMYDEVVDLVDDPGPYDVVLPNGETYEDQELLVELNGQVLRPTLDYEFLGAGPLRTTIRILQSVKATDKLRIRKIS